MYNNESELYGNIIQKLFGITTFLPNYILNNKNTCFNNEFYWKNTNIIRRLINKFEEN
jgi:hypothetical protein